MRTSNHSLHSIWYGLQGKCYKLWSYVLDGHILYELEKVWGVGGNCVIATNLTAIEAKNLVSKMGLKRKGVS